MPEGPEVTIVTEQLNSVAKDGVLVNVELLSGRYTKKEFEGYNKLEYPLLVKSVKNKGKFIYWQLENNYLFSTLGMSGTYKTEKNKYARVLFSLVKETKNIQHELDIFYCDMRNFGTLKYTSELELKKKLTSLGPDMLNEPCSLDTWMSLCEKHQNKSVVQFLMTQSVISGVGNIYKSESLYLAQVSPFKTMKELSDIEKTTLYYSVCSVLKSAYENKGSTIRSYSDMFNNKGEYTRFASSPNEMKKARSAVMVYAQKTDPLGNEVKKVTLADKRTTYFVPNVQK